jgi:hypothetical protein
VSNSFPVRNEIFPATREDKAIFRSLGSHRSEPVELTDRIKTKEMENEQNKYKRKRFRTTEVFNKEFAPSELTRVCTVQIVEGAEGESKEKMVSLLLTASLFPIVSASFLSLTSLLLLLPKY